MTLEFNGQALPDELRRLARKCPGDCGAAMGLAADALETGVALELRGRPLAAVLQHQVRNATGDSKAAIRAALTVL